MEDVRGLTGVGYLRFYVWNYGKEQVWLTRCWADRFRRNQETQKGGCYGDAKTSRASSMERTRGTMTLNQLIKDATAIARKYTTGDIPLMIYGTEVDITLTEQGENGNYYIEVNYIPTPKEKPREIVTDGADWVAP